MRRALFASILFGLVGSSVVAQDRKGIRFWNLTLYTITSFQMSPAGKDSWGHDQCKNDRDGTVDHDERLRITGVEPGRYDVKLADKIGRVCIVRNVEVREGVLDRPSKHAPLATRTKDRPPPMLAPHQPSDRRF
jgi:hypothetical protein